MSIFLFLGSVVGVFVVPPALRGFDRPLGVLSRLDLWMLFFPRCRRLSEVFRFLLTADVSSLSAGLSWVPSYGGTCCCISRLDGVPRLFVRPARLLKHIASHRASVLGVSTVFSWSVLAGPRGCAAGRRRYWPEVLQVVAWSCRRAHVFFCSMVVPDCDATDAARLTGGRSYGCVVVGLHRFSMVVDACSRQERLGSGAGGRGRGRHRAVALSPANSGALGREKGQRGPGPSRRPTAE